LAVGWVVDVEAGCCFLFFLGGGGDSDSVDDSEDPSEESLACEACLFFLLVFC
jgi:hypothetical protein